MNIMKRTSKEDAVSPVVGVMLMLVVTIVIAAVVAAFASGLVTTTEKPPIAGLQLETYSMETHNGNFAPYSMTFKHTGGDELLTKDLVLSITYNGATYSTSVPSVVVGNKESWAAGEKLVLKAPISTYGLSQQDMSSGPESFDWALVSNGNSIAKGTALTTKNVVAPPGRLSLSAAPAEITSGGTVTFTITATSGSVDLKGKTVTLNTFANTDEETAVVIGTNTIALPSDGALTKDLETTLTLGEGAETDDYFFYVSYEIAPGDSITSTEYVSVKITSASGP